MLTTLNAIDYWIGGKPEPYPFYYHVSIFICFIALNILLFYLFLHIFNQAIENDFNKWFALFASGFYALHTANAETINYIIARSDSFSTLMIVLSLVIYLYKPQWRNKFIYLLPVVVGLFVKEPTIMILALLGSYIFLFSENGNLKELFAFSGLKKIFSVIKKLIALLILCLLFLALVNKMTATNFDVGGNIYADYGKHYIITQPAVVLHYFVNFILPVNLSADTDWMVFTNIFNEQALTGFLFLAILLIIVFATSLKKEAKPITFGLLWFLFSLLPTSLVPLAEVLNDHRVFLPYIGLTIAVVWFFALQFYNHKETITNNKIILSLIVFISFSILIAHSFGLRQRCNVWSTGELLWKDVTEKSPKNGRGLMNYGNVLMAKGDYNNAFEYYKKASQYVPNYPYLWVNVAILRNAMGFPQEAEPYFKKALELNNKLPETFYYYSQFLLNQSRFTDAAKIITDGLAISPAHTQLLELKTIADNALAKNLVSADSTKSELDKAIIKASNYPSHDNYINLSLQYYLAQDYKNCIIAAEEALKLNPKSDAAYNNICSAYNMLKDWDNAIIAGQKGLAINPNNQLLKNNLNVSLEEKNKTW
jgi:tetratricopeptide (TPR) repeat protein